MDNYNASNWFENFDFFDKADPTQGFVQYLPSAKANAKSILAGYSSSSETVFMGVDSTTKNPDKGRESIRVESKKTYTRGLFIADIKHMPASICGVWPAFCKLIGELNISFSKNSSVILSHEQILSRSGKC